MSVMFFFTTKVIETLTLGQNVLLPTDAENASYRSLVGKSINNAMPHCSLLICINMSWDLDPFINLMPLVMRHRCNDSIFLDE